LFTTLLTFVFLSLFQEAPQPASGVRARIEGTVLRGSSNEPVAGARITVTAVNPATGANLQTAANAVAIGFNTTPPSGASQSGSVLPQPIPAVTTDRDGKFLVSDLGEGSYRVAVSANGYVRQEYGQRVFPGQGALIHLRREETSTIVLRLILAGNVSGRVIDKNGKPAVSAPVQLLRATYSQEGRRVFQNSGTTRTNDRGEYRLYWITPGRYYLAAGTAPDRAPTQSATVNDATDAYALAYYPGTEDIGRATAVEIQPGDERALDLPVEPQRLYRIRGRVVSPSASRVESANITMTAAGLTTSYVTRAYGRAYNAETGIVEIRDLLPGSYAMEITTPVGSGKVSFEIVNSDLDNLQFTLSKGVGLSGKVQMEGSGNLPPVLGRVFLRPTSPQLTTIPVFSPSAAVKADGVFEFTDVLPAEYRVVGPSDGDYYVKEIRFDGNDALNRPIQIRDTVSAASFVMTISANIGQVEGIVVDERSQPLAGIQAVLVPERNRDRVELFKAISTDTSGRFTIRGISPGDYKVFAWDGLEPWGFFDPEVLKRSEVKGTAVRIEEGSKVQVEVRAINAP
jgi:hypothetical protein